MKEILVIGNKPLNKLDPLLVENADEVYFFPNNSNLVLSRTSRNILIIQDFTLNFEDPISEYEFKSMRYGKATKALKSNFTDVILIGENTRFLTNYYIPNFPNKFVTINHRQIIKIVLKSIEIKKLFKKLGVVGVINYLLCLSFLRKKIPSKYRPSSGFLIVLKLLLDKKNDRLTAVGFSNPITEGYYDPHLNYTIERKLRNHLILDSLIYNKYLQNFKSVQ